MTFALTFIEGAVPRMTATFQEEFKTVALAVFYLRSKNPLPHYPRRSSIYARAFRIFIH